MNSTDDIGSPCTGICRINPINNLCIGCLRTVDEISRWIQMSSCEKASVLNSLQARAITQKNK
jgi:uncharacterized protein